MIFNIFNFQRQIGFCAPQMTVFFTIISLDSHSVMHYLIYLRKFPVYFCPFLKTSAQYDVYGCLSMMSKHLAATVQHLKLHKCGIYSPTTKGLHEGDMSRNWQWFDIEIAQWKVKLLWLCSRRTWNNPLLQETTLMIHLNLCIRGCLSSVLWVQQFLVVLQWV